jgi:type III pantothenate kinase
MSRILAIDAGNTRVKWGLFDTNGTMLKNGACQNTEIAQVKLPDAARLVISNVAGENMKHQLLSIFPKQILSHWITAKASECGVNNNYDLPEKLGTDRWAALIAAWHIKQSSCVVVNAGTAVTIDALNEHGEFLGGMILPGIQLMQQSLGLATAQLPNISSEKSTQAVNNLYQDIFSRNTKDAMHSGSINAACGAIMQMHSKLSAHSAHVPYILMSGGNAELIRANFLGDVTNLTIIIDNLVLLGLYLIEDSMPKKITRSEP